MSVSIAGQRYDFICRKCGRHKKANFEVLYSVDRKYAARRSVSV